MRMIYIVKCFEEFQITTWDLWRNDFIVQLGPNEFYDYDDKFGLIAQEPDPETFFSIENSQQVVV